METQITNKHYGSLDGLRAISCIGIMMMHIQANTQYAINGFIYTSLIPFFTHYVLLFLMISGFGMCVGYFDKVKDGKIDLEVFYKKRYKKLLPFFFFLMVIALVVEPSWTNFFDVTIEISLLYGLLPNNALNVIGVGWTIGVIFLFYLVFPAFVILLKSKKRAWIMLGISIWINVICQIHYFGDFFVNDLFTPRHSFLYCLPLFIGGGIIFLYRDVLNGMMSTWKRWCVLFLNIVLSICYFIVPNWVGNFDMTFFKGFLLFFFWLSYFVGVESKLMSNRVMKFFGDISLELYLCHMFVFRTWEKMGLLYKFGNNWIAYSIICVMTLIGSVVLVYGYKTMVLILKRISKRIRGKNEQ